MTLFVPLQPLTSPLPTSPFLRRSLTPDKHVAAVVKAIVKAKRIVVICGAGISVQAGIPDFRSPEGLFKTIKRDNPREILASGRDLFDVSVFASDHSIAMFCRMIARLSELATAAKPTAFHHLLRTLDNHGKLLRVYTQNIDAIEHKCGLSFGIPQFEERFASKSKLNSAPPNNNESHSNASTSTPRCIPLHGSLQRLHCPLCNHSFPLEDYLDSLTQGLPPQCPECIVSDRTRQLAGKRSRGVGRLRPSVVLYNEVHRDAEGVGEVVHKDLVGSPKGKGKNGADLLLVVGTSLRVPGAKRIVREFAKAVRGRGSSLSPSSSAVSSNLDLPAAKAIYLNLDFPVPAREWDGVFDVWLQGDAQHFANLLQREISAAEARNQRKRGATNAVGDPSNEKHSMEEGGLHHAPGPRTSKPPHSALLHKGGNGFGNDTNSGSSQTKVYLRIPARNRHSPAAQTT